MGPSKKDVKYLTQHDPNYINTLKQGLEDGEEGMRDDSEEEEPGMTN